MRKDLNVSDRYPVGFFGASTGVCSHGMPDWPLNA